VTHSWDPDRYLQRADERGRPFVDLLARVGAERPPVVVDLGCGPGTLTELLAQRWPGAEVTGVDSSPQMLERAAGRGSPVRYRLADLRDWVARTPPGAVDVLVSNATLQWVPGHLELLPQLVRAVRPGGWLALQVPGNLDQPSHVLTRALAAEPPYAPHTAGAAQPDAHDAATYLEALTALGCAVDAWETTYLHVLTGPDPVLGWVSGTGARPFLQALPDGPGEDLRARFTAELAARLRRAYPERDGRVVLPFRRVFAVARVPG
jgi:trans-aconitate 2-methyltransferase